MSNIRLFAALKSGKGCVRTNNEDAYYFNGKYADLKDMDQETTLTDTFQDSPALFAICDGMGGYENGEVASYTAVNRLDRLRQSLRSAAFPQAVTDWVIETNKYIAETVHDGGSTLALLYFDHNKIYIAHLGDSRIYRIHHGLLSRMTKDHSKVQVLLDAGILTEQEAKTYPQRHVITRAFGMNEDENGLCTPTVQEPVTAENGDRYLICSDGVTDLLTDDRIGFILSKGKTAAECARAVYQEALEAGGKDNTTVIVIEIDRTDMDQIKEKDDLLETTLSPEYQYPVPVNIEQMTTIRQPNGQKVTIRTQISST